jgi:hypothetical protein
MNRRTFALLTAVITFTAGVVLARLSLPNLFKTPPPVVIKEVQLSNYRLSGPYEYEHLSIFLIHGADAPGNGRYTPLQEAMERKFVTVHETNHVNELAIENISATEDVFVQAGDIVKGGRQDRVLSVDMILPARSGMVPISAFCVEQSRWQARGVESVDQFTLTEMTASYSLRKAIKDVATQAGVWGEVEASQKKLGDGLAKSVRSEQSPTSLPLALESEAVQETTALYLSKLLPIVHQWNDVIGFAFAINDELKVADVYCSKVMFKQFWPRLLKAAAVEAIATPAVKRAPNALPIETVGASLVNMELAAATETVINARTRSIKRETEDGLFFQSVDTNCDATWIHRSYLSRLKE